MLFGDAHTTTRTTVYERTVPSRSADYVYGINSPEYRRLRQRFFSWWADRNDGVVECARRGCTERAVLGADGQWRGLELNHLWYVPRNHPRPPAWCKRCDRFVDSLPVGQLFDATVAVCPHCEAVVRPNPTLVPFTDDRGRVLMVPMCKSDHAEVTRRWDAARAAGAREPMRDFHLRFLSTRRGARLSWLTRRLRWLLVAAVPLAAVALNADAVVRLVEAQLPGLVLVAVLLALVPRRRRRRRR